MSSHPDIHARCRRGSPGCNDGDLRRSAATPRDGSGAASRASCVPAALPRMSLSKHVHSRPLPIATLPRTRFHRLPVALDRAIARGPRFELDLICGDRSSQDPLLPSNPPKHVCHRRIQDGGMRPRPIRDHCGRYAPRMRHLPADRKARDPAVAGSRAGLACRCRISYRTS